MKRVILAITSNVFLALIAATATAQNGICEGRTSDLAMVWSIDTSSSMDELEMTTQLDGYIAALQDPQIKKNLLNCQCTEVAVLLWADDNYLAFDFTKLDNPENIKSLMDTLESLKPRREEFFELLGYQTHIRFGIERSGELILNRTEPALRNIITVSGDGIESQLGPDFLAEMREHKQYLHDNNITINGLPILVYEPEDPNVEPSSNRLNPLARNDQQPSYSGYEDLEDFYRQEVITPLGYVIKANEYSEFGRAIRESLLRDTCNLMM